MPNGVLRDLYKDAQEVHLRLKLRVDFRLLSSYTFSCTRLVVLVVHDGALVSAPEYQNRLSKKLMIHLTVQSRGALEGTLEGAPNGALSNLHKVAQEDALEVALKGALEVALG